MGRTKLTGSTGARLLKVMEVLIEAGRPVTLQEITTAAGLPKPTVQRLVSLLEELGYAIKEADGRRYTPGPTMNRLARTTLQHRPQYTDGHAVLRRLADLVGEACNLVLLDGDHITYIDRVDTDWPLRLRFEVGSHVPIHCTATGKLLLALQPKRVRRRLLKRAPLAAMTPHSITDPDELEATLKTIRRERVGTDAQEFLREMVAISVPVMPPDGPAIAAVSVHAPVFRRSLEDLRAFLPQLREAAEELSEVLYAEDEPSSAPVTTARPGNGAATNSE